MFLKYEKLLSILANCVSESALTFNFGKVRKPKFKMCEGKID